MEEGCTLVGQLVLGESGLEVRDLASRVRVEGEWGTLVLPCWLVLERVGLVTGGGREPCLLVRGWGRLEAVEQEEEEQEMLRAQVVERGPVVRGEGKTPYFLVLLVVEGDTDRCLVRVDLLPSFLLWVPGSCLLLPSCSLGPGPPSSWDYRQLLGPLPYLQYKGRLPRTAPAPTIAAAPAGNSYSLERLEEVGARTCSREMRSCVNSLPL